MTFLWCINVKHKAVDNLANQRYIIYFSKLLAPQGGYQHPQGGDMRKYETTIIVRPSISQEERQAFFDKVTELISGHNGLLIRFEDWGQRRLAYEIQKESRGYYGFVEFCGDGDLVRELERNIRLDDRGMKYMTICTAQEVDVEAVKREIEAAAAKEKEKEEEAVQQAAATEETPSSAPEVSAEPSPEGDSAPPDTTASREKEATPDGSI
jgi:small subunit ribosomal protein S6